jgi:hypothetical protein
LGTSKWSNVAHAVIEQQLIESTQDQPREKNSLKQGNGTRVDIIREIERLKPSQSELKTKTLFKSLRVELRTRFNRDQIKRYLNLKAEQGGKRILSNGNMTTLTKVELVRQVLSNYFGFPEDILTEVDADLANECKYSLFESFNGKRWLYLQGNMN